MGWASGSDVAIDIAKGIKKHVKDKAVRRKLYKVMVDVLRDHDWDTEDEATGIDPILDKILAEGNDDE